MSKARQNADLINSLGSVTASAAELNKLDGATTTTARLNRAVDSDTSAATGSDQVTNIVSLTQAEYDALTPNATTIYAIVG
jgi:hypothetical protein